MAERTAVALLVRSLLDTVAFSMALLSEQNVTSEVYMHEAMWCF